MRACRRGRWKSNRDNGILTFEKRKANKMVNKLFGELADLEQVEAIALGGSRAGECYDEKSDYDVYVYITSPISEETRRCILEKYCGYMEIGNQYWEHEDNCVLKNDIDIDILYRDLDGFCEGVSDVAEKFQAHNGYTTCMWHNLLNSKIICDKNGRLKKAKERFDIPYPDQLRDNIIKRNIKVEIKNFKLKIYIYLIISIFYRIKYKAFQN